MPDTINSRWKYRLHSILSDCPLATVHLFVGGNQRRLDDPLFWV